MQKVLLIVLVLLIGTGAYFLGKNQINTNQPSSSTPDPTANWKTYEGNGYSFKYPGNFILHTDDPRGITIQDPKQCQSCDNTTILSTTEQNSKSQTLENWLKDKYPPYHPGGNPAYTHPGLFEYFKPTNIPFNNSFVYIYNTGKTTVFSYRNKIYTLNLTVGSGLGEVVPTESVFSKEAEKIYDMVLSTFKFTQ